MAHPWPPIVELLDVTPGRALSLQEWLDLSEDQEGECVQSHLTEKEMPDAVHEVVVSWLI